MTDHAYKVVELVGTSHEGVQQAIKRAIDPAGLAFKNLDRFEVKEIRVNIQDGNIAWYQVKLGIGFRVLEAAHLHRG